MLETKHLLNQTRAMTTSEFIKLCLNMKRIKVGRWIDCSPDRHRFIGPGDPGDAC